MGEQKKEKKKRVINVSFTDTEKDNIVYEEINKHFSKGGYIKDVVYNDIMSRKIQ